MARWFRWYEGTCEDGKFRVVARVSRVTVRDVIALWSFMLEDAAHLDHRGVCKRNEDFMASVLDFPDGVVEQILAAMQDVGMVQVEHFDITICNWDKRQFEGDIDKTAKRRQQERRSRDKDVTVVSRVTHGAQNTDNRIQNTDKKERNARARDALLPADDWPVDYQTRFWNFWPNKVGKSPALKALALARKRRCSFVAIMTGVADYVRDKPPDRPWLNPATFLNHNRWEDQPATVSVGNGTSKQSGSILAAIDRELEKIQREEDAAAAMPEDVVLSLPRRSIL